MRRRERGSERCGGGNLGKASVVITCRWLLLVPAQQLPTRPRKQGGRWDFFYTSPEHTWGIDQRMSALLPSHLSDTRHRTRSEIRRIFGSQAGYDERSDRATMHERWGASIIKEERYTKYTPAPVPPPLPVRFGILSLPKMIANLVIILSLVPAIDRLE